VGNGVVGRKKAQQVSPPGVPRPLRAIVPEVLRYESTRLRFDRATRTRVRPARLPRIFGAGRVSPLL